MPLTKRPNGGLAACSATYRCTTSTLWRTRMTRVRPRLPRRCEGDGLVPPNLIWGRGLAGSIRCRWAVRQRRLRQPTLTPTLFPRSVCIFFLNSDPKSFSFSILSVGLLPPFIKPTLSPPARWSQVAPQSYPREVATLAHPCSRRPTRQLSVGSVSIGDTGPPQSWPQSSQ
eukprot:EG_transcript_16192